MLIGGAENVMDVLGIDGMMGVANLAILRTGGTTNAMHAPRITGIMAAANIARRISSGTDIDAILAREELPAGTITSATSARTINTGTDTNAAITEQSLLPSPFDLSSLEPSAHLYLMNPLHSLMIPFSSKKYPVFSA
jgi:hypothetical protein